MGCPCVPAPAEKKVELRRGCVWRGVEGSVGVTVPGKASATKAVVTLISEA